MKYAILVYQTPDEFAERGETPGQYSAVYAAYAESMSEAGVFAGGTGLLPPDTATTLRVRSGSRQVLDGPNADAKEQLGAFFLVDLPDLDAALDWAAKCPAAARGAVEVRPVMEAPSRAER
jgi:hypothetical protein